MNYDDKMPACILLILSELNQN